MSRYSFPICTAVIVFVGGCARISAGPFEKTRVFEASLSSETFVQEIPLDDQFTMTDLATSLKIASNDNKANESGFRALKVQISNEFGDPTSPSKTYPTGFVGLCEEEVSARRALFYLTTSLELTDGNQELTVYLPKDMSNLRPIATNPESKDLIDNVDRQSLCVGLFATSYLRLAHYADVARISDIPTD